MVEKAPDAFRTISEAAKELGLAQHVLRFWESRFSHVKPMKRGGGRRYYRAEDINLLRGIKILLYDRGMTIKGVQRVLKDRGIQFVASIGSGAVAPDAVVGADEPRMKIDAGSAPLAHTVGDERAASKIGDGNPALAPDDKALLEEILLNLLECKRVLEQAR